MGIAVVTSSASLPAVAGTPPAALADASAGAGSDNFAALLFSQILGLSAAEPDAKTPAIAASVKEDDLRGEDAASLGDGSQLLATLGLITPEVVRSPGNAGGGDSSTGGRTKAGGALVATASAEAGQPALTQALGDTDARAAKFAAVGSDALRAEQTLAASDAPLPTGATAAHAAAHPAAVGNTANAQATTVATPLRDPAWGADFAQKVVWLAGNDKQSAQLTLNPPQMGPIEISLNLSKDSATAVFVSPHAEVRDAIETALPKLREMLAGVGIELGQANVSSESFRQQSAPDQGHSGTTRWQDDAAILPADTRISTRGAGQGSGLGLVDTFA